MWCVKGLRVCGWLALLLGVVVFWAIGCEYNISLPVGDGTVKEGVAGGEHQTEDGGGIESTEAQSEVAQETDPSEEIGTCTQEVACFRCFVEVASGEATVATYGKLLILREQSTFHIVDLETCRRRALVSKEGGSLEIIQSVGFPLLLEYRKAGIAQGEIARMAWLTHFDGENEWVAPRGRVWVPTTSAAFLGRRGFLYFSTGISSEPTPHLTVFYDSIRATFSVPTSANIQPVFYHISPAAAQEALYDVVIFLGSDNRHQAMVWDVEQRRVLSQTDLPERAWLQGHLCFGKEHLVLAESQTDAAGTRHWFVHLRNAREIGRSILRIDVQDKNLFSLPCWYDAGEGVFWVLLQKEMVRILARSEKHQQMPLPSVPAVSQWLGATYGRMWALAQNGELGAWQVEGARMVWRPQGALQRFSAVEGCHPSGRGGHAPAPPFFVLRDQVTPSGAKQRLWTFFPDPQGGRLHEAGEALVPAVMGRMTEFLQCYEAGFSYVADDGQKMEYTAFYAPLSKPLFWSGIPFLELPSRQYPQNNRRIEVLALDGLRAGEVKEVRWQLIDFLRGKIQQEKASVDLSVYTPWGMASDLYVILRGVENGRHRLAVYGVR